MLAEIGGFEQTLGVPPGSGRGNRPAAGQNLARSAAQQAFYSTLARQEDGGHLVKLDSGMSFEQARGLIHSHILDLDIWIYLRKVNSQNINEQNFILYFTLPNHLLLATN